MTSKTKINLWIGWCMKAIVRLRLDPAGMLDAICGLRQEILRYIAFKNEIEKSKENMFYAPDIDVEKKEG